MNSELQTIRRKYNEYFKNTVFPLLGLTDADVDQLAFGQIAHRISDGSVRRTYLRLAIELLEENLRDHQAYRPKAIALFESKKVSELREWQKVSNEWEEALWALVSQGEA